MENSNYYCQNIFLDVDQMLISDSLIDTSTPKSASASSKLIENQFNDTKKENLKEEINNDKEKMCNLIYEQKIKILEDKQKLLSKITEFEKLKKSCADERKILKKAITRRKEIAINRKKQLDNLNTLKKIKELQRKLL